MLVLGSRVFDEILPCCWGGTLFLSFSLVNVRGCGLLLQLCASGVGVGGDTASISSPTGEGAISKSVEDEDVEVFMTSSESSSELDDSSETALEL